ncbi:hypothetical protein [Aquimarina mytili]|uniref:Lipocalin-like domain-containing protein n=1 Tax=Aquimarina mytili TaxID=874423 RepID=A0A937D884_9FLAO|nr:hypothetical protein [Aquimarina mytili]MBL0683815.1 hypothetical protein [Aquimarina mytili]
MKYLILLLISTTILSCGYDSYKHTEDIVGEWTAKSLIIKGKKYTMEKTKFIINFDKDLKYSIDSELTKLANDYYFESIPFRGKGQYQGDYAVVSDNMLRLKEKYRDKITFTYIAINNDELTLTYVSRDNVKITTVFTKTSKNE